MGIAISKQIDLSTNEYILRFIGKEHISRNDPFWNTFLSFNITLPSNSNEQLALESRIEPYLQQLLNHNLHSANLGALLQVFLIRATELISANDTNDTLYSWQAFNALFVIRCIIKYLAELLSEEQLMEHIESGPESKLEALIESLFGIIVDVPLKDITYAVHLEAVTTLLSLLSVQVHTNRRPDQLSIFRLIMKGRHAIHAPLFIKNLLQNFMDQKKAPPGFGSNQGTSIVLGIASELWSMLSFNRKNTEHVLETADGGDSPLATNSLLLILVLTNNCSIQPNPFRQCLFSCANSRDDNLVPTEAPGIFKIDYEQLYSVLCKRATGDAATLLLYLLLHRNPLFKTHLLARMDLDQLVIPILKTLYHAPNSNSHHIYMSLIILLILSEDDLFNRSIHETKLKTVTWYTERILSEVSLGGLLILVVIRTIQYNMLKMKDKYLHTNCLAALANMSAQFRELHPYVSQRLVSLFETLARRYQKYKLETAIPETEEVHVSLTQDAAETEQYLTVLEEVLRMVLEIFNSALTSQLTNNPNLVYTLLYKKDIFTSFKSNSAFQDIIHNIEIIIDYFSNLLSTKTQQHEVDAHLVLNVIVQGAKHWPKDRLTKFPDLKFKYVEEEQPEEFFVPYVWALVNQQSSIHWNGEGSTILNAVC
ncbi:PREDICTED: dymeclin [Nicrophorus vespilloides]|uniref:Dymeclin n=1 Tax=Nicrophorus vespilloides TaxID=110193 RepID=A0ABM1MBL1_NICVS|nr:PREDICTED: dymeclin [Nicrophorus vespilloides]